MTTTVKVTTHDWPAKVDAFPLDNREPINGSEFSELAIVPPHSEEEFCVHDGQDLLIRELEMPAAGEASPATQADEPAEAA